MRENTFKKKYGNWAVIVGAAEGLGKAFSEELAKKEINLIMVDNQQEKLTVLSKNISKNYGVETIPLYQDLKEKNAALNIFQEIKNVNCRLLIYNAGFSRIQPFLTLSKADLGNFISINTNTQLNLVHKFTQHLNEHTKTGGVLLMSSLAGLIGTQLVATYAATKAFTWNLAESLHYELKPLNIDVLSCLAGATETETYLKNNPKYGFLKPSVMQPNKVVIQTLNKLGKKAVFIPGLSNKFNYFLLTRLLPRKIAANIVNKTMFKMYAHKVTS